MTLAALAFRNEAVQQLRRLAGSRRARTEQGWFVVEGPKLLEEALTAGAAVRVVYLDSASSTEGHRALAERARRQGAEIHETQPGVLARACQAVTPQPVAALVETPGVALEAIDPGTGPILLCVRVQDPGNAGTIVRSAAAAGAAAVVFTEGSVDIFGPKATRSSAGTVFQVPLVTSIPAESALDTLGRLRVPRLATAATHGEVYTEVDLTGPVAFVLGSESTGLPGPLYDRIDRRVAIPMAASVESLNVAMAATILCFEASRQRRYAGATPATGRSGAP